MSGAEQDAQREAKRSREANQYFSYQRRLMNMGMPPRDDRYWRMEENQIFKKEHVSAGLQFDKYDDIPVERRGGRGIEEPMSTFQDAGSKYVLPQDLVANFERCSYSVPTPVQKHAIPAACAGTDVMVC